MEFANREEARARVIDADREAHLACGKEAPADLFTAGEKVKPHPMRSIVNPQSELSESGVLQLGLRVDPAIGQNKPSTSHQVYYAKRGGHWVELRSPTLDEKMAIAGWLGDGNGFRPEIISEKCTLLHMH